MNAARRRHRQFQRYAFALPTRLDSHGGLGAQGELVRPGQSLYANDLQWDVQSPQSGTLRSDVFQPPDTAGVGMPSGCTRMRGQSAGAGAEGGVMAEYRVAIESVVADCNDAPVYIRAEDIIVLENSETTATGMVRFRYDGKLCSTSTEDFLNAIQGIEIGDRFVAECGGYKVNVERSDSGWIAGVLGATSGPRWLWKAETSNPETGKKEATEMLEKLASIELRQALRWPTTPSRPAAVDGLVISAYYRFPWVVVSLGSSASCCWPWSWRRWCHPGLISIRLPCERPTGRSFSSVLRFHGFCQGHFPVLILS
jgi:hypothetical protein